MTSANAVTSQAQYKRKSVNPSNIVLGAVLNLIEVTTLGQPFEVIKTTMAANRSDTFYQALTRIRNRGGFLGFYQGLIPWAWIEASTKGAVLLFVSSDVEYWSRTAGAGNFAAGIVGGMAGGIAQAYVSVGLCTCMKTVEITRNKLAHDGRQPPSTLRVFRNIIEQEGIRGVYRGVNAVALRQCTNWGSRLGLARLAEDAIRRAAHKKPDEKLSAVQKVLASTVGGALSIWNQPIEVARIEMQSKTPDPQRPKKLTSWTTIKYIYDRNGMPGLFRGSTPRICLGVWQTICMVGFGDMAKDAVARVMHNAPSGH